MVSVSMSLAMMHEVGLPLREYSRRGGDPAAAVEMRLFATASDGALVGLSPARLVCNDASPPSLPFLDWFYILGAAWALFAQSVSESFE